MERCREGTGKDIDGEGLGEVYMEGGGSGKKYRRPGGLGEVYTEGDRERYRRRGLGEV